MTSGSIQKSILLSIAGLCLCCLFACRQKPEQPTVQPTALPAAAAEAASTAMPVPTPEPTLPPVEIRGQKVSAYTEALMIPGEVETPDEIWDALSGLPNLRTVTVDRAVPEADIAGWSGAWAALEAEFPAVAFTGRTLYQGAAAETVGAFAPAAVPSAAELDAILNTFENLTVLDLRALAPDREAVAALTALAPAVNVLWTDKAFGSSESAWESVILSGPAAAKTVETYLSCFPHLREADLLAAGLTEEEGDALCAAFPNLALRRMATLNGQSFDSFTEEIDLTGDRIDDYDAFSAALAFFPKLRRLELTDCSLSNEALSALRDRYPHAGVIWTVHFGRWACRTDAVAFSTMQSGYTDFRLTAQMASVLRYCTDLIALDLGHNAIDDLSWLEPLQGLQLLILADNRQLRDLTPLASLKKLKYVELFMNPIQDITPLGELPELLDVNLCITYPTDLSPLLNCKKLERIWIGKDLADRVGKKGIDALLDAFPDAEFDLVSVGSTKLGWREHPRFYAYQEMFKTNTPVAPFLPED